jgi:hypothetical protein
MSRGCMHLSSLVVFQNWTNGNERYNGQARNYALPFAQGILTNALWVGVAGAFHSGGIDKGVVCVVEK